jgi:two-component system, OmpR family, sensor histidine kinase KdpD
MVALREVIASNDAIVAQNDKRRGLDSPTRRASMRSNIRLTLRVGASIAFIAATTFVLYRLIPVNSTTAGFLYLVAILLIATKVGLVESTVASVAAMLCFNFFFLPPIGTLTIADPQNWVALFAFLATSLTASQLSARAKRRALEAEERRGEVERLYALSRALLLVDNSQPIAKQIVHQVALTCEVSGVALYERATGELYRAGIEDTDVESRLRESAVRSVVLKDAGTNQIITPIRLGGEPIGSLAFSEAAFSDAALQSLLNLVAIAIERANSQRAVTRAEVARQSEELKSTLLDAIAHEFKTPLTSIKAVTTDLLSGTPCALPPHQHELISIVDESTDRLSKLVTDAIQLARIEGGTFRLNLGVHFPSSLINAALRQMKSVTDERRIDVLVPDDLPPVRVDSELIQVVLTHLLDNALKYSPPSNPITIGARLAEGKVMVYLADQGQGITEEEQAQIFEKFYRGKNERHVQGTGMGLAIAREILRAHGEDIALSSVPGRGSEFSFGLPVATGGIPQ